MIIADTFMMVIILSGLALSGAYFRAQFVDWRQRHTADVKEKVEIRLLYQVATSHPRDSVGVRAIAELAGRSLVSSSNGMSSQETF